MRISDWSSDVCSSDLDECLEVVRVEAGELPPVLEAVLVLGMADEVHGHVFDDGHVLGPVPGAQTGEVVVEDDVEHPVQPVLDAPMRSEEHTSELQSLMRISYAVFCLKKKKSKI